MKRNQKIVVKLMAVATGIMIIATVILTIVGSTLVSNGFEKMNKELLKNACSVFKEDIDQFYKGDWTEKEDGIYKGDTRISENYTMVDALKEDTGLEYSIFYNNMRISTTLNKEGSTTERAVNSPALERIVDIVIKSDQE